MTIRPTITYAKERTAVSKAGKRVSGRTATLTPRARTASAATASAAADTAWIKQGAGEGEWCRTAAKATPAPTPAQTLSATPSAATIVASR